MKKVMVALLALGLSATVCFAKPSWMDLFMNEFTIKGIDNAVQVALENGATPDEIVKKSLTLVEQTQTSQDPLLKQNIAKALYCAGLEGLAVQDVLEINNFTIEEVTSGYQKSVEECGEVVQPYQVRRQNVRIPPPPPPPPPPSPSSP